jgi:Tfp pilus assembly protein PilX
MQLIHLSQRHSRPARFKQQGVVLLITLIMLVAMTLAAISMMRSVDTSNMVAGNLAFQVSSLDGGDTGVEEALAFLTNLSQAQLGCMTPAAAAAAAAKAAALGNAFVAPAACPPGYKSFNEQTLEPTQWSPPGTSWNTYWAKMQQYPGVIPISLTSLPTASGYSGAYVVEAMCATSGRDSCTTFSQVANADVGTNAGCQNCPPSTKKAATAYYYRITVRIDGPRNSTSYVQTLQAWN